MTTESEKNKLGTNTAKDKTLGVPLDGFQDPTGEFPKTNYHYSNSINQAARGFEVNELYVGGGDYNVSLNIEDQQPSQYPFNQVMETASGHVIEHDDTAVNVFLSNTVKVVVSKCERTVLLLYHLRTIESR